MSRAKFQVEWLLCDRWWLLDCVHLILSRLCCPVQMECESAKETRVPCLSSLFCPSSPLLSLFEFVVWSVCRHLCRHASMVCSAFCVANADDHPAASHYIGSGGGHAHYPAGAHAEARPQCMVGGTSHPWAGTPNTLFRIEADFAVKQRPYDMRQLCRFAKRRFAILDLSFASCCLAVMLVVLSLFCRRLWRVRHRRW